jgi:hypothetical protein
VKSVNFDGNRAPTLVPFTEHLEGLVNVLLAEFLVSFKIVDHGMSLMLVAPKPAVGAADGNPFRS